MIYPVTDPARGLELIESQDSFSISNDRRTLSFNVKTNYNIDQIRIVVAGPSQQVSSQDPAATPEPGTTGLLILGLAAFAWTGRRLARKTRV